MKKILVAALAALMVAGGATAALAQSGSGATLKVNLKPNKHGTKKKPKGTNVHLIFTNGDTSLTATKITIKMPKQLKFNTKGFKFCPQTTIDNSAGQDCPAKSKIGSGTSDARSGVNNPGGGVPLTFDVTAFLLSKKKIAFFLQQQNNGPIRVTAVGTLGKASGKFGTKLVVTVPQIAKEFPQGVFNGLVKLDTTLGKKAGRHNLVGITGCPKNKKLPFSATVNFQPNPSPPPTPSVTATTNAKCR